MKLADIGYGNYAATDKVLAVCTPDAAPVKRLVTEAKENGRAIDVTCGKKTKSVILMENGAVLLCALSPEKAAERISGDDTSEKNDADLRARNL